MSRWVLLHKQHLRLRPEKYKRPFNGLFLRLCSSKLSQAQTDGSHSKSSKTGPVRIGCASGFWGDTATSVPQLIYGGNLDFLVLDYLSEITMSLLTAAKARSPTLGYTPDFVHAAVAPFINDIHRKGIRVVSNAGGVNPLACAAAIQEVIRKAGLDLRVAVVTGDDLMPHHERVPGERTPVRCSSASSSWRPNPSLSGRAPPIRRCLDLGADVVITGRCVDSALALGPLMHTVALAPDGGGQLSGDHADASFMSCGAQSTGGIFTDWQKVPDWDNVGFPVVECSSDGSFVLSKPPNTGGLVSFGTVAEQLVYEIGDPRRYLLPDVTCDFSQVTIQESGSVVGGDFHPSVCVDGGAVRVSGAKGAPPSCDYKVCATYMDGFRATAVCPVAGPHAAEKARRTAASIIKRMRRIFPQVGLQDFSRVNAQVLGAEDLYGAKACTEVTLWCGTAPPDWPGSGESIISGPAPRP
uniref:Si:ch73-132f6.5 n=1 Tax=Tetraodon nigroviridis TaxID=99883 RepID=H3CDA1_TETNG